MSGTHTLTTFGPGAHGARGCFNQRGHSSVYASRLSSGCATIISSTQPGGSPMPEGHSRTAPDRDVLSDAAEVFQLLSTPGRLHLLWLLSNQEADVSTLVRAVGGTKAGISQHLAKLRLAGWVDGQRDGRRVLYRVVDPHIVTLVHQAVEHIQHQKAQAASGAQQAGPAAHLEDPKPADAPP